ncbi:MAG: radical SAM protein [bacterium]
MRFDRPWEIRRRNFPDEVYFFAPSLVRYNTDEFSNAVSSRFIPVSVTGRVCALRCEHCRGRILQSMIPVSSPEELSDLGRKLSSRSCRGLLISGGADNRGTVPLLGYAPAMRQLREQWGFKIAVHTGLVDEELASALEDAAVDAAMIDIIGDDATIRDIYHLDATVSDFEASLRRLIERGINVAPHLVIGLHRGEIVGEYRALEMMSSYNLSSLVLVAFNPLPGTPMACVKPADPEEIGGVFVAAREIFPQTPILLGCARPLGEHRLRTDAYALRAGLNGIAYPAEGIISMAREMGLAPRISELCCSLIFDSGGSKPGNDEEEFR